MTTDINALVERLRAHASEFYKGSRGCEWAIEAAEALTAQQQEIDRLRGLVRRMQAAAITVLDQVADGDGFTAAAATALAEACDADSAALAGTAGDGWRGMDSAPKDGTPILAPTGFGFVDVVVWSDGAWRETGNMMACRLNPTRWQPLPTPPAQEDGSC